MTLTRRSFLQGTLAATAALWNTPQLLAAVQEPVWHDVSQWGVEGRGWGHLERKRYYDRLPAKADGVVRPPVWDLSRHSAGMVVRFRSNAPAIQVDYQLLSASLAMPHMPATGVSGLDLYAQSDAGPPRWLQVTRPTKQHVEETLVEGLEATERLYTLYLPLYNGIDSLKIGVSAESSFEPLAPRDAKPLVFYGTSIMHGACASRSGMAIPAILGRRFDRPAINLGFSGNGTMDPEFVELLTELDPAVYCIDCLPNMHPQQVTERTIPMVRRLRDVHPDTPILLVEDRVFSNAQFFPSKQQFHRDNHRALRESYESLTADGVQSLYYLAGADLLGADGEGATDGSHPNDLGFMRYAAAYEQVLRPVLE